MPAPQLGMHTAHTEPQRLRIGGEGIGVHPVERPVDADGSSRAPLFSPLDPNNMQN